MQLRWMWMWVAAGCGGPTTTPGGTTTDSGETDRHEFVDADADGYQAVTAGGVDCNDADASVHPGADEVGWDGVDQDCDGRDRYDFAQLCAGHEHTCGIDTLGRIHCWGADDERTQGAPPLDLTAAPNDGTAYTQLSCGYEATCGLSEGGTLACWGREDKAHGSLLTEAQAVGASGIDIDRVALGWHHGCVLDTLGQASCFGLDDEGQVSELPKGGQFRTLSLGRTHSCGIAGPTSVTLCWGDADVIASSPGPSFAWRVLASGDGFTCGIRDDLSRDCWGVDRHGLPLNEPGPWRQLVAKGNAVCGLLQQDSGHPRPECEGRPGTEDLLADTPTKVEVHLLAAGIDHVCGLPAADREPVCWGSNAANQSTIPDFTPL